MKKIAAALLGLLLTGNVALADGFNPHHHRHHQWGQRNGAGHGGDFMAPLIGGLIIGGMLGAMSQPSYGYSQPRQQCVYRWVQEWDNWRGTYVMVQRQFCQWVQY